MKRFIVTGGYGFIGSNLVRLLLKKNLKFLILIIFHILLKSIIYVEFLIKITFLKRLILIIEISLEKS